MSFNPRMQEAEAGQSLSFQGHPGVHNKFQDSQRWKRDPVPKTEQK